MKDYLEIGKIVEAANEQLGSKVIIENVLKDFTYCKEQLLSIKKKVDGESVYEVSAMADSMIAMYSKSIWMLRQELV